MKQKLEENKGIPASLLWILAIISGLSVANLYYNQPLLNRISEDLAISEFTANLIPMTTQIGYALGLLFIIPLGDLYKRKNIIVINFLLLSVATCSIAMSVNVFYILLASLVTGICSVMPQIFIPIAAQFSLPQNKARNVGMMVSGLLTGILGSRVISGFVGEYWGLAYDVLYCSRHHVALYFCGSSGVAGYAAKFQGYVQRTDEIAFYAVQGQFDHSSGICSCRIMFW